MCASGGALLAVVLAFVVLKYLGTVNPWKLTHWLFSYELGFVKRGLVGTLLRAALPGRVVTSEMIVGVSLVVAAAFIAALGTLALPLLMERHRRRSVLIGLIGLLAPGVGYLLSDLGRFDVLNLALSLLTILAALRLKRFPYPLFLGVSCALLLIHEAALVLAVPLLFFAHLQLNDRLDALVNPARWTALALRLCPLVLLFGGITFFGRSELALGELLDRLAEHADFAPSPRSAYVLLRGLDSNVAQVVGGEPGPVGLALGHADALTFSLVFGMAVVQQVFTHVSFRVLDRRERIATITALHLTFAAPFVLLAVGIDWERWAALASAQSAMLMMLFARGLPASSEAPVSRDYFAFALGLLVVAAGSGHPMEGARRGLVHSPQANVLDWLEDRRNSAVWYEAFLVPRPEARRD